VTDRIRPCDCHHAQAPKFPTAAQIAVEIKRQRDNLIDLGIAIREARRGLEIETAHENLCDLERQRDRVVLYLAGLQNIARELGVVDLAEGGNGAA
jgi:hypothetical protein